MAKSILKSLNKKNDIYKFQLYKISEDKAAKFLKNFFHDENYSLEDGNIKKGIYGKGSAILHKFIPFTPRYKFGFNIYSKNNETYLEIEKGMTGLAAGLIGFMNMEKEFHYIISKLELFFKKILID